MRAVLLASLPLQAAGHGQVCKAGSVTGDAGWWLLAVTFTAMLVTFLAGIAVGWCWRACARPAVTASAVVSVQAAAPAAEKPAAGQAPLLGEFRQSSVAMDIIFAGEFGEKFHQSSQCLRDCGGKRIRQYQACRRCASG